MSVKVKIKHLKPGTVSEEERVEIRIQEASA
jgi:hypothetical protein